MEERLALPVYVDNDSNTAMLAEHRAGAARGALHAAMLTLGTGIGGGLVLGGRLYRGAHGGAAELGHVVVDINGPPCQGGCPGRGCLEVMASGTAIGREGAAAAEREPGSTLGKELRAGREITGALVTELAHDGDETARRVLELIGERLGVGITSIVNALNPEVVVIGGGAIAGGELLLEPARRVVAERALAPSRDQVRIVPAHFGDEAGLLGAGTLAAGRRRGRGSGVGRGDAADLGSRVRAGACMRGGRTRRRGAAGAVGRARGVGGVGPAGGSLALRRVPAATPRRAAARVRGTGWDAGR